MLASLLWLVARAAALQVMAGDGATEAEAVRVEARLQKAFAAPLEAKGFKLEPLDAMHAVLRKQGVPEDKLHEASNSPANTARIVRLRELDTELHWMNVLTHSGDQYALVLGPMQFHDLTSLGQELRRAPTLEALEKLVADEAPALVDAAVAKFKPTPMPSWWRPQTVAVAAPAPAVAPAILRLPDGAHVAVLDFKRSAGFSVEDARYLTDVVRAALLQAAPRLSVMTRENLLVLLQASGKDLAECEGECEVDTGRRIGADAVVSGDVLKFGSRFKLSLRLHETRGGQLLSAAVASGATLDELDTAVQEKGRELVAAQK